VVAEAGNGGAHLSWETIVQIARVLPINGADKEALDRESGNLFFCCYLAITSCYFCLRPSTIINATSY
jgi:hypothetical protein